MTVISSSFPWWRLYSGPLVCLPGTDAPEIGDDWALDEGPGLDPTPRTYSPGLVPGWLAS